MAVVVWPPPDIIETVARLKREPGINWSKPAQWMVKLRPLGRVCPALVDPLTEVLTEELAETGPTTATSTVSTVGVAVGAERKPSRSKRSASRSSLEVRGTS